jgi:hypothetical protein
MSMPTGRGQLSGFQKLRQHTLRGLAAAGAPVRGWYNLTVGHRPRFVWYRVAKVGTRSFLDILDGAGVQFELRHPHRLYYLPGAYRSYFRFVFVRNPWDRLVSCWHNKVVDSNYFEFTPATRAEMQDFGRFVDHVSHLDLSTCNAHLRLQSRLMDLTEIDFLGRFENFENDVGELLDRLGLVGRMSQRNRSMRRADHTGCCSADLRDRVAQLYARDIRIFGYEF